MKKGIKIIGFTLIELIVTITILAILATIAFISLSNYLSLARDSTRKADITNIKKSLDITFVELGKYPLPDNGVDITFSGSVLWNQGNFGENSKRITDTLSKLPLDPAFDNEYTYSVTKNQNDYQIGAALENELSYSFDPLFTETYANEGLFSYIDGTYNGIVLQTSVSGITNILSIPSLIASSVSNTDIVTILQSKKLSYNGDNCLAESYSSTISCGTYTNWSKLIAFSGSLNDLSNSESERINLLKNIQNAYLTSDSDSEIVNTVTISPVLLSKPSINAKKLAERVTKNILNLNINPESITYSSTPYDSIFSEGNKYTSTWNSNICSGIPFVEMIEIGEENDKIQALLPNTVYVLEEGTYSMTGSIYMDDCTALIGIGNVRLESSTTLSQGLVSVVGKQNIIIDNIQIDGEYYNGGLVHSRNLHAVDLNAESSSIFNVKAFNNSSYGLNLDGSSNLLVSDYRAYNNGGHGIHIFNTTASIFSDVISYNNESSGIAFDNSDSNTLNNTIVYNNEEYGFILATGSDNNSINNSISFNNDNWGLRIQSGTNNLVSNFSSFKNSSWQFGYNITGNILNNIRAYGTSSSEGIFSQVNNYYGEIKSPNVPPHISIGSTLLIPPFVEGGSITSLVDEGNPLHEGYTLKPDTVGWNTQAVGRQSLTFSGDEKYYFGNELQNQIQPLSFNGTNFSTYGTDGSDYNTAKNIGEKVNADLTAGILAGPGGGGEAITLYDIFLVAGQSNTHYGSGGYDASLDAGGENIKQWGRFSPNQNEIIDISSGLDHVSKKVDKIGFAVSFSKKYISEGNLLPGNKVLLIPTGLGSTGFYNNFWNQGDSRYIDAVTRVNTALVANPGSSFKGILWHQGEEDSKDSQTTKAAFKGAFQTMISDMRTDITGANVSTPFVLGGMVPAWIDSHDVPAWGWIAHQIEDAHIETVSEVNYTGYADGRLPTELTGVVGDGIHYDAISQRVLGERYYDAYISAQSNN